GRGGMKHLVHWDDVPARVRRLEAISASWTDLGTAAGSLRTGLNRIAVDPGKRSTPVHVHGAEEEIFYVVGGDGLLWLDGVTSRIGPGDAIVHLAGDGEHTLIAGERGLAVLAFGTRVPVELCYLPRAGHAWAGPTVLAAPGLRNLFRDDDAAEPLEIPVPGDRP